MAGKAAGIDAADGCAQAALPTEKLVGEFNLKAAIGMFTFG